MSDIDVMKYRLGSPKSLAIRQWAENLPDDPIARQVLELLNCHENVLKQLSCALDRAEVAETQKNRSVAGIMEQHEPTKVTT